MFDCNILNDLCFLNKTISSCEYILIDTKIDLYNFFYRNNIPAFLTKFENGSSIYFISDKFCIINGIRYFFDSVLLIGKNRIMMEGKDFIIKYSENSEYFYYNDIVNEYNILRNDELLNFDFIKKQSVIDFEKNENYSILVRNKICGELIDIKSSSILKINKIIRDILEQLSILEEYNYIYNDLWLNNILYNEFENKSFLIDLGSYFLSSNNLNLNNIYKSKNYFNLIDTFVLFLYLLLNINGYREINTDFNNIKDATLDKILKNSNAKNRKFLIKKYLFEKIYDYKNYNAYYHYFLKDFFYNIKNNRILKYKDIEIFFNKFL